jgi:glutathione S-transferase
VAGDELARIHGYPISTWTRTVRMTCVEKGIEYELVPVAYGSDEHGLLHPFRRMPILEVGGMTVFETLAATGYLDEAFDGPALQPADPLGRVAMRTWMGVSGDYVFRDVVRTVPRGRAASEEELATARLTLGRVEELVAGGAGPFLAGPDLTLADLYLAPQIANCAEKAPELLVPLTAIGAWLARIAERESFRQTIPPDA